MHVYIVTLGLAIIACGKWWPPRQRRRRDGTERIWIGVGGCGRGSSGTAATAVSCARARSRRCGRDLQIAAEDDATYGDFVIVVTAAIAAGFADWQLRDPHRLATRPSP